MRVVGDGALLAALAKATGRGMRDIVATIQREQDEAIRSPAGGVTIVSGGPGHRQDRGGPAPGRLPALLRPQPVRRRRRPGGRPVRRSSSSTSPRCCRRSARTTATLRSLGSLVRRASTRPGPTRPRWPRSRARCGCAGCWNGRPHDAVPDGPDRAAAALPGRAAASRRRRTGPRSGAGRCPGAPGATRSGGPASTGSSTRSGRRHSGSGPAGCRRSAASRTSWPNAATSGTSSGPGGPGCTRGTCCGWLAQPERLRAYANGILSTREIRGADRVVPEPGGGRADHRRRGAAGRAGRAAGPADAAGQAQARPVPVAGGVREVSTYADRQRAARAERPAARPDDYRDYAHVVVDEAQDVSPMQWRMIGRRGRLRLLDGGRRPGPDRLDRRPGRAGPGPGQGARAPRRGTSSPSPPTTATRRRSSRWPPR